MLKKVTYLGVFEPTEGSGYSVYFPDLPGCTSYGETLSEAQSRLPLTHLWLTLRRRMAFWCARSQCSRAWSGTSWTTGG